MARKHPDDTIDIKAAWWDEGETVTLRRYLSHGMSRAIQQAYVAAAPKAVDPSDPTSLKLDPAKALEIVDTPLLYWMVRWSLRDKGGNILPLDQSGLDALVDEDVDYIKAEIDKLSESASLSEDAQASFLETPPAGITG